LEAALRSGAISGPEYTKIRDQLRAQQGQFKQDMPGQALAADVGGSRALPLGVIAKPVTRGLGMLGDVLLGTRNDFLLPGKFSIHSTTLIHINFKILICNT
jgi:hypothetical protein